MDAEGTDDWIAPAPVAKDGHPDDWVKPAPPPKPKAQPSKPEPEPLTSGDYENAFLEPYRETVLPLVRGIGEGIPRGVRTMSQAAESGLGNGPVSWPLPEVIKAPLRAITGAERNVVSGAGDLAARSGFPQTGEALRTASGLGPEPKPTEPIDFTKPFDLKSVLRKTGVGIGEGAPSMIAPILSGPAAPAVFGAQGYAQSLPGFYKDELARTPQDPEGARARAEERAGIEAGADAVGWKLFDMMPFSKAQLAAAAQRGINLAKPTVSRIIADLSLQAGGVQPATQVVNQIGQNHVDGKPLFDGVPDAYAQTLLPNFVNLFGAHVVHSALQGRAMAAGNAAEPGVTPDGGAATGIPATNAVEGYETAHKTIKDAEQVAADAIAGKSVVPAQQPGVPATQVPRTVYNPSLGNLHAPPATPLQQPQQPPQQQPQQPGDFVPDAYINKARAYLSDRTKPSNLGALADALGLKPDQAARVAARLAGTDGSPITFRNGVVRRRGILSGPLDAGTLIAGSGGVRDDEGHDIAGQLGRRPFIPGKGPLIRPDGMSVDRAGELLWDHGFFGPPDHTPRPGEDEVLDVLDRIGRGERVYKPEEQAGVTDALDRARQAEEEANARDEIFAHAQALGEHFTKDDVDAALQHYARHGDPESAVVEHIESQVLDNPPQGPEYVSDVPYAARAPQDDRQIDLPGTEGETPADRAARIGRERIAKAQALPRAVSGKEQRPMGEGMFAPPPGATGDLFTPKAAAAPAERPIPGFFSALQRAIEGLKQIKAAPSEWAGIISNLRAKGIKEEQIHWSGIMEWLAEQKGQVTKEDVLNHLRENDVAVTETARGGPHKENVAPDAIAQKEHTPAFNELNRKINEAIREERNLRIGHRDTPEYIDALRNLEDLQREREALAERMHEETWERLRASGEATGRRPMYEKYTLPGGKNYRELLLKLPNRPGKPPPPPEPLTALPDTHTHIRDSNAKPEHRWGIIPRDQGHAHSAIGWHPTPEAATARFLEDANFHRQAAYERKLQRAAEANQFNESHWSEPNVLAHIRFDTRRERAYDGREAFEIGEKLAKGLGVDKAGSLGSGAPDAGVKKGVITPREAAIYRHARNWEGDKTGAERKIMHIAEFQSDWHNKGREQGYRNREKEQALDKRINEIDLEKERLARDRDPRTNMMRDEARWHELSRERERLSKEWYEVSKGTVPNAPFKQTWHELAFKRALRYAVEHGFDEVHWDTGKTNADRYDLSKHVSKIEHFDKGNGEYEIGVFDKRGRAMPDLEKIYTHKELEETFGKDIADKIANGHGEPVLGAEDWRALKGLDLKVGGEGKREFYDRILPRFASRYIKKWGAKVEPGLVAVVAEPGHTYQDTLNRLGVTNEQWQALPVAERIRLAHEAGIGTPSHKIAITPEMREGVMAGQPLMRKVAKPVSGIGTRRSEGLERGQPTHLTDQVLIHALGPVEPEVARVLNEVERVAKVIAPGAAHTAGRDVYVKGAAGQAGGQNWERAYGARYWDGMKQAIAWSVHAPDAVGIFRHEALHYLRSKGLIRLPEWNALRKYVLDNHLETSDYIKEFYPKASPDLAIEEAAAHAIEDWGRGPKNLPPGLRAMWSRIRQFIARVGDSMRRILGKDPTHNDVYSRIMSGEIGRRDFDPNEPFHETAEPSREPMAARAPKDEEHRDVTETPAFKRWFGQSVVRDDDGKPQVMYHTTTAGDRLTAFKRRLNDIGIHFGTKEQAEDRFLLKAESDPAGPTLRGTSHATIPVYLSIKNPIRLEDIGAFDADNMPNALIAAGFDPTEVRHAMRSSRSPNGQVAALRDLIKRKGYDGIVYLNTGETGGSAPLRAELTRTAAALADAQRARGKPLNAFDKEDQQTQEYLEYKEANEAYAAHREDNAEDSYIALDPTQIKSAIGNTGAFNPRERDITKAPAQPQPAGVHPIRAVNRVFDHLLGPVAKGVGEKVHAAAERFIPFGVRSGADTALEEARQWIAPMAAGSNRARAMAMDFIQTLRVAAQQWGRVDDHIVANFDRESRQRIYDAMDAEGTAIIKGEKPPANGLASLTPRERALAEDLNARGVSRINKAIELGMFKGDPIPFYVPRMIVKMVEGAAERVGGKGDNSGKEGTNLKTTTAQLKHRKYVDIAETAEAALKKFGEGTEVVRDIRTLPLALRHLDEAIAGRILVNGIKAAGEAAGEALVHEGTWHPDSFTINHPALRVFKPDIVTNPETGKKEAARDQAGNIRGDFYPIHINNEFKGPLTAVLKTPDWKIERALMSLKGKTMSVIMFSPAMHNAVIWGKAFPADPVNLIKPWYLGADGNYHIGIEAYGTGAVFRADPKNMDRMVSAGMAPIGRQHGTNAEVTGIASEPTIVPGRSWTAKLLGQVPRLWDPSPDAGRAVKEFVDKLGDFTHNTLLWDRIADLQAGIFKHITEKAQAEGMDQKTADRVAAVFANQYAGSIPMEAMSRMSRFMANLILFSRSFTLSNLAAWKTLATGLPKGVQAQIERDAGTKMLDRAQGMARRKAITMVATDIAMGYIAVQLGALAVAVIRRQATGLWQFANPNDNEPDRTNRFLIGYDKQGTAIYGRMPVGKVGEDLQGWAQEPRTTFLKKLSPFARIAYAAGANDKGFGRKLYDETDNTLAGDWKAISGIMGVALDGLVPLSTFKVAYDMMQEHDWAGAAQSAVLPVLGITLSHGYPEGPARGFMKKLEDRHRQAVEEALPDVFSNFRTGNPDKAWAIMDKLNIDPKLARYYYRMATNPDWHPSKRELKDLARYATPEEERQFNTLMDAQDQRNANQTPQAAQVGP